MLAAGVRFFTSLRYVQNDMGAACPTLWMGVPSAEGPAFVGMTGAVLWIPACAGMTGKILEIFEICVISRLRQGEG